MAHVQTTTLKSSGRVAANGLCYYYEIHGQGEPLLLLHGGLGSIDMFGPILPALAADRMVIGVDLHGHGRTQLGDRAVNLVDIGNDLAVILDALGHKQVDVLGYSFGGGAALRLALQHPGKVRRAVVVSAGYSPEGFWPDIRAQQVTLTAEAVAFMKETPMYTSYVAVAPDPEEFPRLVQAMGDYMREDYDWSDDVRRLSVPTMIAFGDADMYQPAHIINMFQMMGGGLKDGGWMREGVSQHRLAIVPGATHYDIFFSPQLVATVKPFLDGTDKPLDWASVSGR